MIKKLIFSEKNSKAYLIETDENGLVRYLLTIECKSYKQYSFLLQLLKPIIN